MFTDLDRKTQKRQWEVALNEHLKTVAHYIFFINEFKYSFLHFSIV